MGLFFNRKKKTPPSPPALLRGTITVGNRTWHVSEERRQGPRPQVFVLRAADNEQSQMHIRPLPGQPLATIEDVEQHAEDPEHRWFHTTEGLWEARLVVSEDAAEHRVKFVSWTHGVHEGEFPAESRLGVMTDEDLVRLLEHLRNHHGSESP